MGALFLVRESSAKYENKQGNSSLNHQQLYLNGKLEASLAALSDDELLESTEGAVETERRQGVIVVKHFNEIYRRQLFLARGFPNMFEMLRKRYLYCAGSAQLRISSMKLMADIPEVEAKLETGELSMSAAAQLQTFFRAEKKIEKSYSPVQKLALVQKCEGKSTREVERELASINPSIVKTEFVKPVSATQSKLTLTVSNELVEKLDSLRALNSHVTSKHSRLPTYEEIILRLANAELEKSERSSKMSRGGRATKTRDAAGDADAESADTGNKRTDHARATDHVRPTEPEQLHAHEVAKRGSRYITASVRKEVLRKNGNEGCAFTDAKSGRRCGSQTYLQIDHITPHAHGGDNLEGNLRVLCGAHNRFVWNVRKQGSRT